MYLIIVACLLILIPSLQALSEDNAVNVIYQTSFSSDPHWITNNPSTNYWNPNLEVYNFSIEPIQEVMPILRLITRGVHLLLTMIFSLPR